MNNISEGIPIIKEKKEEALDFILNNAFKSGFGVLSKRELDTILFAAIYMYSSDEDKSDHYLSKYLQTTQTKIRNLKELVSVKYNPISLKDAIDIFIVKLEKAKREEKYIDIPINDIAVKNEIEGILDQNDILLHTQLNSKIFRVRIDDLMELLIVFESFDSEEKVSVIKDRVIEGIAKNEKELEKIDSSIIKCKDITSIKSVLLAGGIDIGLEAIKLLIPGGVLVTKTIETLMKVLKVAKMSKKKDK